MGLTRASIVKIKWVKIVKVRFLLTLHRAGGNAGDDLLVMDFLMKTAGSKNWAN
jgi:hypothetical protein